MQQGPAVAVLNPIGSTDAQPPVVLSGDDHIAGAGQVSVGQLRLSAWPRVVQPVAAGTLV
jgi:hypothetical protein